MKICYDNYAKTAVFSHHSEGEFLHLAKRYLDTWYLKHFPKEKTSVILEIGCGQGRFIKLLLERGYKNVYGVDMSEDQILYGKEHFGLGDYLRQIDAMEFLSQAPPNSYDVILLLDVLEHMTVEDSIRLVKLAHRALKPAGTFLIQVPNGLAPLAPQRYGDITHYRCYTVSSMRQSVLLGGFKEMFFFSLPPIVHGTKSFIRRVLWAGFINPLINCYMLVAEGTRAGGIFTSNFLTVVMKEKG